jgi:hypothetical protein
MIDVQIDTATLEAAIAEFAIATKKDLGEIYRQQAGILVGHVIAITPPGGKNGQAFSDSGGIALAAKKHGESAIASDIAKLFPTSNMERGNLIALVNAGFEFQTGKGRKDTVRDFAETTADLARVHQFARNPRTGRTRKMKGVGMAVTRKAVLKQYIRQEIAKVGKLNAGWIAAAREMKTANRAVPAWITRHGAGKGGSNFTQRAGKIGITVYNNEVWFPSGMDSRVGLAVRRRESGLRKAIEAVMERRAKAAEKRMGR